MSDIFSRLASRAGDLAPRARPVILPRYARRAPPAAEDVEVEAPDAPAKSAQPRMQIVLESRPPLGRETAPPSPQPPPSARAPATPPAARREEIERVSADPPEPLTIVERTLERRVETRFEHAQVVDRPPVAAPPPPMRAPDVAALRQPETKQAEIDPPRRFARSDSAARSPGSAGAASDAVHVSIGRIEVRAVSAPPPPATPPRLKHTPMGLDEYLRRRNEAS